MFIEGKLNPNETFFFFEKNAFFNISGEKILTFWI